MKRALLAIALGAALLLEGCALTPEAPAMQAPTAARAGATLPGLVLVNASGGGTDTGALQDAEFKTAIEASLLSARAFEGLAGDSAQARWLLAARVVSLTRPAMGATFPTDMEVAWTLTDRSTGAVPLRKPITSHGSTGAFSAFAGGVRARLALEAAVRENIGKLIAELPAAP